MTVICPACDARFRDPPEDVPTSRPLQCSNCEHEWLIGEVVAPRIKMDTPSLAPSMADLVDGKEPILTALPIVMPESTNEGEPAPKREPIYVDRETAPVVKQSYRAALPMAGMACIALFAATVAFKDTVMAHVPQSTPLYRAAGLVSKAPGLEIANVVTTKSKRDGIRRLIVKGEIENVANNTVPVPPIKLIMRGESNASLYAWTVTAAKASLKAGEKSRFTAVAQDFPVDAVNVEVEFAPLAKDAKK